MELVIAEKWQAPPMPRYGLALQERRELVGFRTQSDLSRAVRALEADGELPGDLRPFSQQWLSTLEDDRTGDALLSARSRQIRALSFMLRWSAKEFEENVGIPIPPVPHFDASKAATPKDEVSGQPLFKKPEIGVRHELPAALKEAARLFGDREDWKEIRTPRWQNFMFSLHHRKPPQTPEDWLALFLDLRERFDPPEIEGESGSDNQ